MNAAGCAQRCLVIASLAAAGAAAPPAAAQRGVLEHHNGADRSGTYTMPTLTRSRAAGLHRDTAFDGSVQGAVYAQPLYWDDGAGSARVVVATEDNVVEALDAKTGKAVWQRRLGPSVPHSDLPCGNIVPLGITGTPTAGPTAAGSSASSSTLRGGP